MLEKFNEDLKKVEKSKTYFSFEENAVEPEFDFMIGDGGYKQGIKEPITG